MSEETIREYLTRLRLYMAAAELAAVLATQKQSVPLSWLDDLLAREWDARQERAIMKRINDAEFP